MGHLQDSAAVKVSCSTIATSCWQLTACGVIGHAKQASRLLFHAQDDQLRLAECQFLATYRHGLLACGRPLSRAKIKD
jgi:hypothetical protein